MYEILVSISKNSANQNSEVMLPTDDLRIDLRLTPIKCTESLILRGQKNWKETVVFLSFSVFSVFEIPLVPKKGMHAKVEKF